jgi:hypothetical protein
MLKKNNFIKKIFQRKFFSTEKFSAIILIISLIATTSYVCSLNIFLSNYNLPAYGAVMETMRPQSLYGYNKHISAEINKKIDNLTKDISSSTTPEITMVSSDAKEESTTSTLTIAVENRKEENVNTEDFKIPEESVEKSKENEKIKGVLVDISPDSDGLLFAKIRANADEDGNMTEKIIPAELLIGQAIKINDMESNWTQLAGDFTSLERPWGDTAIIVNVGENYVDVRQEWVEILDEKKSNIAVEADLLPIISDNDTLYVSADEQPQLIEDVESMYTRGDSAITNDPVIKNDIGEAESVRSVYKWHVMRIAQQNFQYKIFLELE